jgi:hypothetical protein
MCIFCSKDVVHNAAAIAIASALVADGCDSQPAVK